MYSLFFILLILAKVLKNIYPTYIAYKLVYYYLIYKLFILKSTKFNVVTIIAFLLRSYTCFKSIVSLLIYKLRELKQNLINILTSSKEEYINLEPLIAGTFFTPCLPLL